MISALFSRMTGLAAATALVLGAGVSTATADTWNERTMLEFSEPVMIPGATLPPGRYEFRLMDLASNRHMVQVRSEDGSKTYGVVAAVPVKRDEAKGDVVLKFNPTDAGSPPAIKGWFYPGSIYGHEFVYSDDEARKIAQRTKTIVLSTDVADSDREKGTLYTYDASGKRGEWRTDAPTMAEWEAWQRDRAEARVASETAGSDERRQATAPMVRGDGKGVRVSIRDLEDNPQKYMEKTISVDATIEKVLGPRLFTIDEDNWMDLDGEILAFVPTYLAALVREDDRVTITGTVRPFASVEIDREWGFLGLDDTTEVDLSRRPVLVASRVVGGDNDTALLIEMTSDTRPVGTSGRAGAQPLGDLGKIARGGQDLIGRHVQLDEVTVASTAKRRGFFARSAADTVLVLPSSDQDVTVNAGDTVTVEGVVLQLPDGMEREVNAPADSRFNDDVYVLATRIDKQ
jgi:hypothetical protein